MPANPLARGSHAVTSGTDGDSHRNTRLICRRPRRMAEVRGVTRVQCGTVSPPGPSTRLVVWARRRSGGRCAGREGHRTNRRCGMKPETRLCGTRRERAPVRRRSGTQRRRQHVPADPRRAACVDSSAGCFPSTAYLRAGRLGRRSAGPAGYGRQAGQTVPVAAGPRPRTPGPSRPDRGGYEHRGSGAHGGARLGAGLDALYPAEKAGLVRGDRTVRRSCRFSRALGYSTASLAARRRVRTAWTNLGPARCAMSASDGERVARDTALTGRGRRIVRPAACGLSHQEIADQRSVWPRTVASHLYKVFPRPGIGSRRELDRALQELGDHT